MKITKKAIAIMVVITIFGILLIIFFGLKFLKHERYQNAQIIELQQQVYMLKNNFNSNREAIEFTNKCKRGGYNYLAIGNSITRHPICDYWWNECGMAATVKENEYYHKVVKYLEDKYTDVNSESYGFAAWECLHTDRAEALTMIDSYLNENIDLITIQLGENATELDTFESDFEYLITYIAQKSPNAKIIVIGDVWEYNGRDAMKKEAADKCGAIFVDMSEIKDNSTYQCGMKTVVYDSDGNPHTVEHEGVAIHPGDLGMQYIAEAIISALENK